MVHVGNGFYLAKQLYASLFDYQREGVLFLWGLFEKKKGGILGDDMGYHNISILDFIVAEDDGDGDYNQSYKTCKAPVRLSVRFCTTTKLIILFFSSITQQSCYLKVCSSCGVFSRIFTVIVIYCS